MRQAAGRNIRPEYICNEEDEMVDEYTEGYENEQTGYDKAEEMGLEIYAKPPAEIGENAPRREWEELISSWMTVQELGDQSNWTLGDIANEVERCFGKSKDTNGETPLDKFANSVGERKETVRQYAWVSRAFPKRVDRVTGLSWSHYRAAAKMSKDGTQMTWIDEAVKNDWTVARLIEEIKNVQDAASVENGRPCSQCGGLLPESGSYHVRQDGHKVASLCSTRCLTAWAYERAKNEAAQLASETPQAA